MFLLQIKLTLNVFAADQTRGDSHLKISVIPMLGHLLYTCEYSLDARAWQGFVAILSV
jgi:hypothetical protein